MVIDKAIPAEDSYREILDVVGIAGESSGLRTRECNREVPGTSSENTIMYASVVVLYSANREKHARFFVSFAPRKPREGADRIVPQLETRSLSHVASVDANY